MTYIKNWRDKLFTIQEWSVVARGCVPVALVVLLNTQYLLWALYVQSLPEQVRIIAADFMSSQLWTQSVIALGAALVLGFGLWLRRRQPDAVWYQHLSAHYYALAMCWGGYLTGTLSLATGVVLMGAPLVGFILLERRVVVRAFATAFCVILGFNLASAFGLLPYAPLLVAPHDPASALQWTHSQLYFAAPHLIVNTMLVALMILRWRQREAGVLAQSQTDALTGVHNRRSILRLIEKEVARTRRHGPPLAVVILDLDFFKRINDTWGHPTGDRVLQETTRALMSCVRQCDAVGRFGGEEFLLLLPDTSQMGALHLADRCRMRLEALEIWADNGERVPISASFGLACNEGNFDLDADVLVRLADEALYRAKLDGRNRVASSELPIRSADAPAKRPQLAQPGIGVASQPVWRRTPRAWRQHIGGMLEWSQVSKTGLLMGIVVAMYSGILAWLVTILHRDDRATLINVAVGEWLVPIFVTMILMACVLLLTSFLLERAQRKSVLFQHVTLQFYGLSLIAIGYVVGILYMPTGIMLTCSPMVGFILFRYSLVLWVFGTALLSTIVLAYASALGWLPYAPLLTTGTLPAYQLCSPFWVGSSYLFMSFVQLIFFILADQILGRWREREAHVRSLSLTDALTSVHNRRSILELLDREVARACRHGPPLTLVILDLDFFKKINDTWGHPTGDRVLKAAAQALRSSIRQCDAVGRYGGEEFLLVLPDTTQAGALALAERCRECLAVLEVRADNGEQVPVSASFGLACNEVCLELASTALIHAADGALYHAKANGRNRVEAAAPVQPDLH